MKEPIAVSLCSVLFFSQEIKTDLFFVGESMDPFLFVPLVWKFLGPTPTRPKRSIGSSLGVQAGQPRVEGIGPQLSIQRTCETWNGDESFGI